MTEELARRIKRTVDLPSEDLVDELPVVLSAVDGQVESVALDNPYLLAEVLDRVADEDLAAYARENPETVDQLQDLLWTGVELLVRFSPDVRQTIIRDRTVAFEATDAPVTSHLVLDAGDETLRGGPGLLADPDLAVRGSANELTALMTGRLDLRGETRSDATEGTDETEPHVYRVVGRYEVADDVATTLEMLPAKLSR